jgi:hypothetical protein
MVRDAAPTNFEQTLRQLVVGHVQNTTQQANKLTCEIMGCKEDSKYGFRVGTHPLLMNKDDIPAFLELQKADFEELKALKVDTEWTMHPDRSMEITMMCVEKYLKTEAGTYIRMLHTQQQFAVEQLQAIASTYEGSSFLTRTNSTAYRAAAMAASITYPPRGQNRSTRFNQNPISIQRISGSEVDGAPTEEPRPDANNARSQRPAPEGNWRVSCSLPVMLERPWFPTGISTRLARALAVDMLMPSNAGHQPQQISAAEHKAASLGILASGRDYNQMQFGESYEQHSGSAFSGSNRYISSARPGAEAEDRVPIDASQLKEQKRAAARPPRALLDLIKS